MKSAIVFTALLALAAAVYVPANYYNKPDSQNELIPTNDEYGGNKHYEDVQEQEERDSIAASFGPVVEIIRRYKASGPADTSAVTDEIAVPDTVVVGSLSDTYLTGVRVKGLKQIDEQTVGMSWKEDLVHVENSWPKLTVTGVYKHVNSAAQHSGKFEIVLVKPEYSGNTSLTRNANIYPSMSPGSWFTFTKAVIDHAKLPEVFQNEKPQFENFVKNVVSQYVATAVSTGMYNDITMKLRKTVSPYLKYRNEKIDPTAAVTGKLDDGSRFELKNIRVDMAKNNLAKIYEVQMNYTGAGTAAKLVLRVLDLAGESDWSVTGPDGKKNEGGKLKFKIGLVRIVPALNFADKTVHTEVSIKSPQIDAKPESSSSDSAAAFAKFKEQMTEELVQYFVEKLAQSTSQNIQDAM